jgi:hypothetical protein
MMTAMHNPVRTTLALAGVAAMCSLGGCKAREMAVDFADKQAASVDNSWLIAANHCWPDLKHQGFNIDDVKHYLVDPLHFRATFAGYSPLSDSELRAIVTKPVNAAPAPDTSVFDHSTKAVLTRNDALSGMNPQGTLVSQGNGLAPADTLCAIQPGVPVGFR